MRIATHLGILACTGVLFGIGGCASCNDHLLVHIEHAQSRTPAVGAAVEFRPPMSVLPPPVWRGKTNTQGDLRICVDFADGGVLQMKVGYDGYEYASMFGGNSIDRPGGRETIQRPEGGSGPEIRIVVVRAVKR